MKTEIKLNVKGYVKLNIDGLIIEGSNGLEVGYREIITKCAINTISTDNLSKLRYLLSGVQQDVDVVHSSRANPAFNEIELQWVYVNPTIIPIITDKLELLDNNGLLIFSSFDLGTTVTINPDANVSITWLITFS